MPSDYKKVAIEAALKSGFFIKRSLGKIKDISYKGKHNIVTDIDRKSESIIVDNILSAFPDHSILCEESLPKDSASSYKWVIDPLDGTTNFVHAFPFFCVSIGLEKDGKMIVGVVYDPMRDELFSAEAGKGAYLNKKRIHVSKVNKLSESFLATGFSYGIKMTDKNINNFKHFLVRTLAVRRAGSAALDMSYVACSRFDGFWEMALYPWDTAAASLIVQEAGGCVTKFDGSPYSCYDRHILATNGLIHKDMLRVLKKI